MNEKAIVRKLLKMMDVGESYTARVLDKLGGRVVDELAKRMIEDEAFDVKTFFKEQQKIHNTLQTEKKLRELAEDRMSGEINGETVDGFSAYMVSRVLDQLTQEQKVRLLSKPTNEIITIAYKLASRAEI